jgi:hypothetical protein
MHLWKSRQKKTYGFNDSSGDGVMRTPSVYGEGTESVDWRGRAWRGVDGVFGERHLDLLNSI